MASLRRSKMDQTGRGRKVGIHRASADGTLGTEMACPVKALAAWVATLKEHGITRGPFSQRERRSGFQKRVGFGGSTFGDDGGNVSDGCGRVAWDK